MRGDERRHRGHARGRPGDARPSRGGPRRGLDAGSPGRREARAARGDVVRARAAPRGCRDHATSVAFRYDHRYLSGRNAQGFEVPSLSAEIAWLRPSSKGSETPPETLGEERGQQGAAGIRNDGRGAPDERGDRAVSCLAARQTRASGLGARVPAGRPCRSSGARGGRSARPAGAAAAGELQRVGNLEKRP